MKTKRILFTVLAWLVSSNFSSAAPDKTTVYSIIYNGNVENERVIIDDSKKNIFIRPNFVSTKLSAKCASLLKNKKNFINTKVLRKCGFIAHNDEKNLTLIIEEDPFFNKKDLSLIKKTNIDKKSFAPAKISSYLNFHLNTDLSNLGYRSYLFNGATNLWDYSSEYTIQLLNNNAALKEFSIYKDFFDSGTTLTLGETFSSGDFYLPQKRLIGAGIRKNLYLTRDKIFSVLSEKEFLVKQQSILEVIINDSIVYSKIVDPGIYDIKDFPIKRGVNLLKVRLKDPQTGRVIQEEDLGSFVYSDRLIRKGDNFFDISFGLPRNSGLGDEVNYKILGNFYQKDPLLTITNRYGLLENLSIGTFSQLKSDYLLIGASSNLGTSFGLIGFQTGASLTNGLIGFRSRVDFSREFRKKTFSFGIQKEFSDYRQLSSGFISADNTLHSFYAKFGIIPFNGVSAASSIFLNGKKDGTTKAILSNSASYFYKNKLNLSLNASFSHYQNNSIVNEDRVSFGAFLTINIDDSSVVRANSNFNNSNSLGFQKHIKKGNSQTNLIAELTKTLDSDSENLRINHLNEFFSINSETITSFNKNSAKSRLSLGSSVSFADGEFGISRPINGGFIIFKNDEGINSDYNFFVNRSQDKKDWLANPKKMNSVVLLDRYSNVNFNISLDSRTPMVDIKDHHVSLETGKRTGYLLKLKGERTHAISGRLITKEGYPISGMVGSFAIVGNKNNYYDFFTDESGLFYIDKIKGDEIDVVIEIGNKVKKMKIINKKDYETKLGDIQIN